MFTDSSLFDTVLGGRIYLKMFSSLQKVISFLLFGIILFLECSAVIIKTKQGSLDGVVLESRNGTKYHAFMGIPYVKPPVGSLRFEVNFVFLIIVEPR